MTMADSAFNSPTDGDEPRSPTAQWLDGYRCPPSRRARSAREPGRPSMQNSRIDPLSWPALHRAGSAPARCRFAGAGPSLVPSPRPTPPTSALKQPPLPRWRPRADRRERCGSTASHSRCARMLAITSGPSMLAITRSQPWQRNKPRESPPGAFHLDERRAARASRRGLQRLAPLTCPCRPCRPCRPGPGAHGPTRPSAPRRSSLPSSAAGRPPRRRSAARGA
jgi:hypothetical protein